MVIDMCNRNKQFCITLVLFLLDRSLSISVLRTFISSPCDITRAKNVREGNLGQSAVFPWIGLLRVYLYEDDISGTGVTGIVLVKDRYAIAHANDIHRVPRHVFLQNSTAMFIPTKRKPWVTKIKDYVIHPEFSVSTYNTLALIELDLEGQFQAPFKPICWPNNQAFDASNKPYALGFTDENTVFEKVLYSLNYVEPSLCREFYKNLTEPKLEPTNFRCGSAVKTKKDCVWENGMVLISNSSRKWTLLGFGLSGPGCAMPGRFIDMTKYFLWIESVTDSGHTSTTGHTTTYGHTTPSGRHSNANIRRKSAFYVRRLLPSQRASSWRPPITTPTTTTPTPTTRKTTTKRTRKTTTTIPPPHAFREYYRGLWAGYSVDDEPFEVYKVDKETIALHKNSTDYFQSCGNFRKVLIYREKMRIVDTEAYAREAALRITIYDKNMETINCLIIKIVNGHLSVSPVQLWYSRGIIKEDGGVTQYGDETPSEILKYYPLPQKYNPRDEEDEARNPFKWGGKSSHLKPVFITDKADYTNLKDWPFNILFKFKYKREATVDLSVFGLPKLRQIRPATILRTKILTPPASELTVPPEHWRRAHSFNEVPFKRKKNRFEKARERIAERKAIERRDWERAKGRKIGRKFNKIERKVGKKTMKTGGKGEEQSTVSTTTESGNIFGFVIPEQGRDNLIHHYFLT